MDGMIYKYALYLVGLIAILMFLWWVSKPLIALVIMGVVCWVIYKGQTIFATRKDTNNDGS